MATKKKKKNLNKYAPKGMFVTKKEQPNRVGHHLKRTAQRKFDILKFGQLSVQLKKGEGRREKLVFSSLPVAVAASGLHI
jgi:hypothetical protein